MSRSQVSKFLQYNSPPMVTVTSSCPLLPWALPWPVACCLHPSSLRLLPWVLPACAAPPCPLPCLPLLPCQPPCLLPCPALQTGRDETPRQGRRWQVAVAVTCDQHSRTHTRVPWPRSLCCAACCGSNSRQAAGCGWGARTLGLLCCGTCAVCLAAVPLHKQLLLLVLLHQQLLGVGEGEARVLPAWSPRGGQPCLGGPSLLQAPAAAPT